MKLRRIFWLAGIASVSFFAQTLSANVIGTITVNACSGGGVTVTATTITWSPNGTVANTGCVDTGTPTNLTWSSGGSLGLAVAGNIMDLTSGGGSVNNFMTFPASSPTLDFVLSSIGPGSSNIGSAACAAANSNGLSCSVVTGSPFVLTYDSGNTIISLSANGSIVDPNTPSQTTYWSGAFSVTDAGQTPSQVYATFISSGNLSTGNQGQFTVSASPEPGTIAMMLIGGLLLISAARIRKANA